MCVQWQACKAEEVGQEGGQASREEAGEGSESEMRRREEERCVLLP